MPGLLRFTVLIPARYASTRLPGKPLADIAGKPMVVRVAERARDERRGRVVVATDDERIVAAARAHGFDAFMTRADHPTGTDRLAEAAALLALADDEIVVNVQGDEPLLPPALIGRLAHSLAQRTGAAIATACVAIDRVGRVPQPERGQGRLRRRAGYALYFSRATIPWARDAFAGGLAPEAPLPPGLPVYRHFGLYAYRAGFLRRYPRSRPVADRALRGAGAAARALARLPDRRRGAPRPRRRPASTRPRTWSACARSSRSRRDGGPQRSV